jgi:hypothetical protein
MMSMLGRTETPVSPKDIDHLIKPYIVPEKRKVLADARQSDRESRNVAWLPKPYDDGHKLR